MKYGECEECGAVLDEPGIEAWDGSVVCRPCHENHAIFADMARQDELKERLP